MAFVLGTFGVETMWISKRLTRRFIHSVLTALVVCLLCNANLAQAAEAEEARRQQPPTIEVFVREGCPYCAEAKKFLLELQSEFPELRILEREVSADPDALNDLRELAKTLPQQRIGVPTFRVGAKVIVGFSGPEGTGRDIRRLLGLDIGSHPNRSIKLPVIGETRIGDYSLPIFTILVGLIDGFNPCALWVLLFILSLLVHFNSRRKMLVVAGTFVLISGAVYFAFMAAWLNFFLLVGAARWVQVALAVVALSAGLVHVKDYFAYGHGPTLSIPEQAKPWIGKHTRRILQAENLPATLLAVSVLAFLVNAVELLCTAGLPAMYTQVLSTHALPGWKHYAYLLLYNAAYMLDDSIMVFAAVLTLNPRRLGERGGRRLKLVSGLVMIGLATLLVFKPEWLSW
jgi:glutaredoxin